MEKSEYIEPITQQQQAEVIEATSRCIALAADIYEREFSSVPVDFDLRGKCAGMYQVRRKQRRIRYNPWLFAKYYQDSLSDTVTHEVGHYIVDCLYGSRRVKPHGPEWKSIMLDLGGIPRATGDYDLTGIPMRQYQRFDYLCGCRAHQLTIMRHRKIQRGRASYLCQFCHGSLQPA
ncbi:SprT-like domain-containing protein [Porticoccaceae bacterium]|nr:SprT-like domain-containing protein [Porticoccaceae bacterium]